MKYKNIPSAVHNFGHSFMSGMNYIDDDYVMYDVQRIHRGGRDITIDWLTLEFEPKSAVTPRIKQSLYYYGQDLKRHFASQNVELASLKSLVLRWPAGSRKFMEAVDDRGKLYKIYVRESN